MEKLTTIRAVREWRSGPAGRVGLVPTMGHLHAGHLALVEAARARCDRVIVSIFVNPTQFGPDEDLAAYPRTLEADCAALERAGADGVFIPDVDEMYPNDGQSRTTVHVAGITEILCGRHRPGHFEGVATVVAKLFGIVAPDVAFFGEKDYQQLMVIRRMVRDLCMGVVVEGVETMREVDGLALSSRNTYLDQDQRHRARALSEALADVVRQLAAGNRDFAGLEAHGRTLLASAGLQPDYFEIRDDVLQRPAEGCTNFRVLAAAYLGDARLIDNMKYIASAPCCSVAAAYETATGPEVTTSTMSRIL